jgi:hypothetical protein
MSANKVNKVASKLQSSNFRDENTRKAAKQLFIYVALLFILLLTVINIETYQPPGKPVKVLGTETQINDDQKFWEAFLSNNPNYIPGWIETGRLDKVKEIDPNYITP